MPEVPHPVDADLQQVLDAAEIGVWRWDPRRGTVVWDRNTLDLFGVDAEDFGDDFDDFVARVHPEDRETTVGTIMEAATSGGVFRVRHRIVLPGGDTRWVEGRGFVQLQDGEMVGGAGIVYDVTARQDAEARRLALEASVRRAESESATSRRRMRALIEADAALSGTLHLERLAARLADFVVHHGATLAAVDVLRDGVIPATLTVVRQATAGRELVATGDAHTAPRAMQRIAALPGSPVRAAARETRWWEFDDPAQQDAAGGTAGELLSLPLIARGKPVGRLTAAAAGARWSNGRADLLAAVAQRAGTALLQAELYTERGRVAAAFRNNLVPLELAEVPGLDVAVEYRPMHELASLGGDFYDVFPAHDGSWALAVGDVCGKGVDAAALAAPSRHSLRAAVLATRAPAAALDVLNRALLLERSTRFLTAAVAIVDPASRRLRIATGGHPAPVVLRADGSLEQPPASGHLLGVLDGVRFEEAAVDLAPGDSLVMFTDGLTEARMGEAVFGAEALAAALRVSAGLPAKAITESVAAALDGWAGAGNLTDDVVVLVARAT